MKWNLMVTRKWIVTHLFGKQTVHDKEHNPLKASKDCE